MARRCVVLVVLCLLVGGVLAGVASAQVDPRLPNDPYFSGFRDAAGVWRGPQWDLMDRGTWVSLDGVNLVQSNYGIQAQKAWGYFWDASLNSGAGGWWKLPGQGVTIAIIGGAIDAGHEDFAGTTILPLKDYEPKKAMPASTRSAGTIAATTGNAVGIAGIAFGATLLPIKVGGSNVAADTNLLASAIKYAAGPGAQVILVERGTYSTTPDGWDVKAVINATREAVRKGAVIVAGLQQEYAAGAARYSFPPLCPDTIAVGELSFLGNPLHREFSPFLDVYLDLVAPGQRLADDDNGDGLADGISLWSLEGPNSYVQVPYPSIRQPAAQVAAVAALVRSAHPDWSEPQVRAALLNSAYRDDRWTGTAYGYGLVDAWAALNYVP